MHGGHGLSPGNFNNALWLIRTFDANVLMLDEPTNHLDLESITAVNEGLKRFKGSIIFTSHDHELIQTVANRIIEIDEGVVYDNHISYEEYLALKKPI